VDVTRELVLPVPPDEVWAALTDPERLEEWFASEVELEPEPGGRGLFRWGSGEVRRAFVEEVEPERRFAFRWREEAAPTEESRVTFTLEELPEGTRLTVTESTHGPRAHAGEWSSALELRALLSHAHMLA
jgi:uncharacterized protein YndB with AHSA1/START domain